jgi:hypothetical protein
MIIIIIYLGDGSETFDVSEPRAEFPALEREERALSASIKLDDDAFIARVLPDNQKKLI